MWWDIFFRTPFYFPTFNLMPSFPCQKIRGFKVHSQYAPLLRELRWDQHRDAPMRFAPKKEDTAAWPGDCQVFFFTWNISGKASENDPRLRKAHWNRVKPCGFSEWWEVMTFPTLAQATEQSTAWDWYAGAQQFLSIESKQRSEYVMWIFCLNLFLRCFSTPDSQPSKTFAVCHLHQDMLPARLSRSAGRWESTCKGKKVELWQGLARDLSAKNRGALRLPVFSSFFLQIILCWDWRPKPNFGLAARIPRTFSPKLNSDFWMLAMLAA